MVVLPRGVDRFCFEVLAFDCFDGMGDRFNLTNVDKFETGLVIGLSRIVLILA